MFLNIMSIHCFSDKVTMEFSWNFVKVLSSIDKYYRGYLTHLLRLEFFVYGLCERRPLDFNQVAD